MGYRFVRMGYAIYFCNSKFVEIFTKLIIMKKFTFLKMQALLFAMLVTSAFSFAQTLDQSYTPASLGGGIFSASPTANVGQSFTAGITGNLSQINLLLIDQNSSTATTFVAGDFQVKIFNGNGYGGTLLNTTTVTITSVSTTYQEQIITLSSVVPVTQGNNYTIYFTGITGTVGVLGPNAGYANGSLYYGGGSSFDSYDLWFKTFVNVPTPATHLNFDGVDDNVRISGSLENYLTNNVTVELWVKSNETPQQDDALFAVGQYGLGLSLNTDGTVKFSGSGGFTTINSTTAITDGEWHHVAGSFSYNNTDGTNASLYIDGVLESNTTTYENGQIAGSSYLPAIGGNDEVPGRYFTGSIDELRIWGVARTASEINSNKGCELTGTENDLLAYYTFNQGFGGADNTAITALEDATVNAYDGVFNYMSLTGLTSNFLTEATLNTPTVPSVTTPVQYNQNDTATALTATTTSAGLVWYTTATGGTGTTTAPTPSTATLGSTSYWVASINSKGCESARTEIVVTVNPLVPATHLNFDGVDDLVQLPNESNFDFTNQMTIEFWMKSGAFPTQWDAIIAKGDDSWRIALNDNGSLNFAGNGGFGNVSSSVSDNVIDDVWHHVAATYNGTIAIIYIDGVASGSVAGSGNINNSSWTVGIGENFQAQGRYYTGNLDEVRIWNIAKTETEINASKDCELQGNEAGLVAYYKFNQGNSAADNTGSSTLIDATGNNNGTLGYFALTGTTSNFLAGSPVTTGTNCALSTASYTQAGGFTVYPNPSNGIFNLEAQNNATVTVFDMLGKQITSQKITVGTATLNLSSVTAGIYFAKITTENNQTQTVKLIKK